MQISTIAIYLISINILSFLYTVLDYQLYIRRIEFLPDVIDNILTIIGGSLGSFIAQLIFGGLKTNKSNLQARVYTVFWLLLQIVVVFSLFGPKANYTREWLKAYYNDHIVLCWYFLIINIITSIVFTVDKIKAILHKWRVPEYILFGFALIGGAIGGMLAMDLLNHKVNSMHFMVGIPLLIIIHLFILAAYSLGFLF